jgi:LysM repeat protein
MFQASNDHSNINWVSTVIQYVVSRSWFRVETDVVGMTRVRVIYNGEVPLLKSPSDTFACQVHPRFGKRQDNSSASCILPSGVTVEPPVASFFASLSSLNAAESASSAAIAASIASVESVSSVQASLSALSAAESASSAAIASSIASASSISSVQASLSALSAAESASILSAESVSSVQASLNALSAVASRLSALSLSIASVESVSSVLSPTIAPTPPCTEVYVVVSGDTCYLIWTKFGITEAQLYSMNPTLNANCNITIGQVLCVAWNPPTTSLSMAPSTTENNTTTPTGIPSVVSITPTGPVITGNPSNLPALPKLSTTDTMCPSPFGSTVIYEPKTGTGQCPTYPTPLPSWVITAPTTTQTTSACDALGCGLKCSICPGGLGALTEQAAKCPPNLPSWNLING